MTYECSKENCCPCTRPARPLGRIIRMAALDGYIVVRDGNVVEIGDRLVWNCAKTLLEQARGEVNCVSDLVVDTASRAA